MDYVSDAAAQVCNDWENRFKALPHTAGVLFVSVKARPSSKGGDGHYHVVLGLDKRLPLDESTGLGLIMKVLEKEVASGLYEIEASIYLGR